MFLDEAGRTLRFVPCGATREYFTFCLGSSPLFKTAWAALLSVDIGNFTDYFACKSPSILDLGALHDSAKTGDHGSMRNR
jgi:hypothetical protein